MDLGNGPFQGKLSVQGNEAKLLDRTEQLKDVLNQFEERAEKLFGQGSSDKMFSPAIVVAQAPGAGKSHFLAEFGDVVPDLYDLQKRSRRPIVSAFTYNSKMTSYVKDVEADLVLRILYGAAVHMSAVKCEWKDFVRELKRKNKIMEILSIRRVDRAVMILREWYGQRPVVILADELGKSNKMFGETAEGFVRRTLCGAMDSWGSQVYVLMSALSEYDKVIKMFPGSNRRVRILVLPPLGVESFDLFKTKLEAISQGTERGKLKYRIALAWGATGGYARAIEIAAKEIARKGDMKTGVVPSVIRMLGDSQLPLPKAFSLDDLEGVLKYWEGPDCPAELLDPVKAAFLDASYDGRVLIDTVVSTGGVVYVPTVAPWHAAKRFTDESLRNKAFSRCERLMEVIGNAYQKKIDAIEGDRDQAMMEASSYLTEVTAAWGVMLAMVKNYDNLPSLLKNARRSTSQIGLDTTLAEDTSLATPTGTDETEAVKKLKMFLQKAIPEGRCEKPFLVMAPPNCMAVDFLVFQDNVVVAVQVKSDSITEPGRIRRQKDKLRKAANTIEHTTTSMNFTRPMQFLAVLGSNYNTDDLEFPCLKQDDLVRLIPPFLRQLSGLAAGVQSLDDE